MEYAITKIFRFAIVLAVGLLMVPLVSSPSIAKSRPEIQVITSLFPLQEFARAVGGERAEVHMIFPPGAEVHTAELKPGDVAKISEADIFIFLGPSMEPWADRVVKALQSKSLVIVEASRELPFMQDDQGEGGKDLHSRSHRHKGKADPHIWLDFSLCLKMVDSILSAFLKKDPDQAVSYQENAQAYKAKLTDLDRRYQESLASCQHRQMILGGHAAFGYLARRYGLEQIALSGVSPHDEPTPRRMAGIIDHIRKRGVKYIFAEEMVHPKMSQTLAKEAGVSVLILNPGGNLTADQARRKLTFLDLMEKNLQTIQMGLECRSP
jgi:zinc transport system substrate-binding protein